DGDGQPDHTVTADENGDYSVELDEPLTNGEEISVSATDKAGNKSEEPATTTAPDTTKPTVTVELSEDGKTISGTTEPGATVEIDVDGDGQPDHTVTADENGDYSVELDEPLTNGEEISVSATDKAGNKSEEPATTTAPDTTKPTVTVELSEDGKTISGTTEPGATVEIDVDGDGQPDHTVTADENGDYSVELDEPLTNGEEISVSATDKAGNKSEEPATTTAPLVADTPILTPGEAGTELQGGATVEPGENNVKVEISFNAEDANESPITITLEKGEDGTWDYKVDAPATLSAEDKAKLLDNIQVDANGKVTLGPDAIKDSSDVTVKGYDENDDVATDTKPVLADPAVVADEPQVTALAKGEMLVQPGENNTELTIEYTKPDGTPATIELVKQAVTQDGVTHEQWVAKNPSDDFSVNPSTGAVTFMASTEEGKNTVTATGKAEADGIPAVTTGEAIFDTSPNNTDAPRVELNGTDVVVTPGDDNTKLTVNYNDESGNPQQYVVNYDKATGTWTPATPVAGITVDPKTGAVTLAHTAVQDNGPVTAVGANDKGVTANSNDDIRSPVISDKTEESADAPTITPNADGSVTITKGDDNERFTINFVKEDDDNGTADEAANSSITAVKNSQGEWTLVDSNGQPVPASVATIDKDGTVKLQATAVEGGTTVKATGTDMFNNTADAEDKIANSNPKSNVPPKFDNVENAVFTVTVPEGDIDSFTFDFNLGFTSGGYEFKIPATATFTKVDGKWESTVVAKEYYSKLYNNGEAYWGNRVAGDFDLKALGYIDSNGLVGEDGVYTFKGTTAQNSYILSGKEYNEQLTNISYTDSTGKTTSMDNFNLINPNGVEPANPTHENPTDTTGLDQLDEPVVERNEDDRGGVIIKPNNDNADTMTVNFTDEDGKAVSLKATKDATGNWALASDSDLLPANSSIAKDGTITLGHDDVKDFSNVTATVEGVNAIPASKTIEADRDPLPEYIKGHEKAIVIPEDVYVNNGQVSSYGMTTLINYAQGVDGAPAHGTYTPASGATGSEGLDYTIDLSNDPNGDKQYIVMDKSFGRSPIGGRNDHNVVLKTGDGGDTVVIGNNLGYRAAADASEFNRNSYIDMGAGDDLLVVGGSNYDFDVARDPNAFNGLTIVHSPDDSRTMEENDVGDDIVNLKKINWADKDGGIVRHAEIRMGDGDDSVFILGSSGNTNPHLAIRDSYIDLGNGNNQLQVADYTEHFTSSLYQQRRGEIGDNTVITAGTDSNNYIKAHRIDGGSSILLKDGKDYVEFNDVMKATISTGAGDDTVKVKDELQGSTILLGDGNDTFIFEGTYLGADIISGGAGIDTLRIDGLPDGSGGHIVNGSMANIKGFEIIQLAPVKVLDITYEQLSTDATRTGPLKVQQIGEASGINRGAIDLGGNNWNSDAFIAGKPQNLNDGEGEWKVTGQVREDGIVYNVYHYSLAGSNTQNDVWVQDGMTII
ncbi:hypothetical protein BMT54_03065, partial [Pasteurellaceae bacterium 15-036681]